MPRSRAFRKVAVTVALRASDSRARVDSDEHFYQLVRYVERAEKWGQKIGIPFGNLPAPIFLPVSSGWPLRGGLSLMGKGMLGKGIPERFIPLPSIPLPAFGSIDNSVSIFCPKGPNVRVLVDRHLSDDVGGQVEFVVEEFEFITLTGETVAVATLLAFQRRRVGQRDVTHGRESAASRVRGQLLTLDRMWGEFSLTEIRQVSRVDPKTDPKTPFR